MTLDRIRVPLRVLFVGPYRLSRGFDGRETVEYLIKDLLEAAGQVAEKSFLLTGQGLPDEARRALARHGASEIVEVPDGPLSRLLGSVFPSFRHILAGVQLLRRHNIAVVTTVSGETTYGCDAALIGALGRRPVVMRVPGDELRSNSHAGRYRGLRRVLWLFDAGRRKLAYLLATDVLVMSRLEAERVRGIAPRANRVHCIPRGVDTKAFPFRPLRQGFGAPLKVLFVGRSTPSKGLDLVLEAAKLSVGEDMEFHFVDDNDPGQRENLVFRGPVAPSRLPGAYAEADCVLLPSRHEGFPQVVAEAFASGRPCVLSRPVFEPMVPSDSALFCELDAHSIVECLTALQRDLPLANRLARAARRFVEQNLERSAQGRAYAELLAELGTSRR